MLEQLGGHAMEAVAEVGSRGISPRCSMRVGPIQLRGPHDDRGIAPNFGSGVSFQVRENRRHHRRVAATESGPRQSPRLADALRCHLTLAGSAS